MIFDGDKKYKCEKPATKVNTMTMNNPKADVNSESKKMPTAVPTSLKSAVWFATDYEIWDESIGTGSFGEVYKCSRSDNINDLVAIKVEKHSNPYRQLHHEYKVNRKKCVFCHHINFIPHLFDFDKVYQKLKGGRGIPNVRFFGETDDYDYMVLDLLGPSLERLFDYCGRRFSACTTLMLADQILSLIEFVHEKEFIHRDIKPENLVLGTGIGGDRVFLIDFGLSRKFITTNGTHIPYKTDCSFIGTARYASINSQRRVTQSRRDDLESIGYVLVYFLNGALPWQVKQRPNESHKQRKERILELKVSTPISKLCANLPIQLQWYLKYCRERVFDEKPNYVYLRKMLR